MQETPRYSSHGHIPLPTMHVGGAGVPGTPASSSPLYGKEKRKSYSDSPSTSPGPIPAGVGQQQPRPPPGTERTSASGSASMRVGSAHEMPSHQLPHGFPPGMAAAAAHSQLPHEHLQPHHPFPYSFEPSSHPSLHMWQQSQMHGHQPISSMHPAHLPPSMAPPGIWYGQGTQLPHLIAGQDLHAATAAQSGGKKAAGAKGKRDGGGEKMATNQSNNNNNNCDIAIPSAVFLTSQNRGAFAGLNSAQVQEPKRQESNNDLVQGFTSPMLNQHTYTSSHVSSFTAGQTGAREQQFHHHHHHHMANVEL